MPADYTERFLRIIYSTLLYLLMPITVYHLIWRGFRVPAYFQRWGERYGHYGANLPKKSRVWLHAVSVGEVNAAAPLVNALRKQRPDIAWVITTITPTGSERVRAIWGDTVDHVYLPYDVPSNTNRFLAHFNPHLALIMETELWPNLLFSCRNQKVPVYILNARLSGRSLRGYRVLSPLVRHALRTVRCVAAQSAADAKRFILLGALPEQVTALGNMKFDIPVPNNLDALVSGFHEHIPIQRPVWIAASTHDGEEAAVIEIHQQLLKRWPDLLLLWAPRHPERFSKVTALAREQGWATGTRRQQQWPKPRDGVFVIDTLGELMAFYACAKVAFVGGSLQAIGGHNLLEPAAVGVPVVTGPHLHNFSEISRRMKEADAVKICANSHEVSQSIDYLLENPAVREAMVQHAYVLVTNGQGAVERTVKKIAADLPPTAI